MKLDYIDIDGNLIPPRTKFDDICEGIFAVLGLGFAAGVLFGGGLLIGVLV